MRLLKTMGVLALVAGLLWGGVVPAQADTGVANTQAALSLKSEGGKQPWAEGNIEVIRGEVAAKGTYWIEVAGETIIVDGATEIRVPTLGKEASFDDIQVGMKVVALVYEKDGLHARHILVVNFRLLYGHHVGTLLAYEAGVSITIEDRWGEEVSFDIDADKFKELPPGVDMEQAVDEQPWVTVITRGQPLTDSRTAIGVVVHPLADPVLARLRLLNQMENGLLNRLEWHDFESISGIISVDEAEELVIVDSTELSYDSDTVFILRGVTSAEGEWATVFYKDGLARVVLVGVEPPEIEEG
jgi:hypothetical protein